MSRQLMIAEVLSQPQAVSWLPWAVQYFFFIGIAACAARARGLSVGDSYAPGATPLAVCSPEEPDPCPPCVP